jgi:O-antigen/teichoic acid export membrane protein
MDAEVTLGEVDLTTVKTRSLSGVVTLISRSFLLQIVSTAGFFLLSIFLGRPEIGLFIAVNDLVSVLGYFSDIGLAASLIQKRDKVNLLDLRTTFTLQQVLVFLLLITALILSPVISAYYHISGSGLKLFYCLLAAFFLASLKTIPSVILERQLKFQVLALVEVVETLVFYIVAVVLAWQGRGVASYAWAVILRGIVGTTLIYYLAPWKIGIAFSRSSLKTLLSFGLPYQINSTMAVIKDRFLNIALWKIIGADGVGIIGWAQTWSQKPLRFIMDNVTRVTFPAYARMQDHPDQLKSALEKTLFFITLITFPVVGGLAVLAPVAVRLIPKYGKWEVALLPLALYCFNSALASVSTPLTNTLNAIGKVKINTYLMIMWTALAWLLTPWLAVRYGFIGVSYASAIIALSSIVPVIVVRRYIKFDLMTSIFPPTLATVIMLGVSFYLSRLLPISWTSLIFNLLVSAFTFLVAIYLLAGQTIISDGTKLWHAFRKK